MNKKNTPLITPFHCTTKDINALIILSLSLLCISIPCHSAQIPIDTFLLKPIIEDMSISPDGKFVAGINNAKKDRQFLMTHELKTGESFYYEPRENGDVYDYTWASDTKLMYNVSIRKMYYLHMGVIDRYMKNNNPFCYSEVGHIVDGIPADSTRAIIVRYDRSYYSVLEYINLETLRTKKVELGFEGMIVDCKVDKRGTPQVILLYQSGNAGVSGLLYYNQPTTAWLASPVPEEFKINEILFMDLAPEDGNIYVAAQPDGHHRLSVFTYDLKKGELGDEVFSDTVFDFDGTLHFFPNIYDKKISLKGITYNTEYSTSVWFDPRIADIQKIIDNRIPNSINQIVDADKFPKNFLICSYSDVKPTEYHIYNRHAQKLSSPFKTRPWVIPEQMCPTQSIRFPTKDLLEIQAYLTEPKTGKRPFPTVLHIHGGPWVRDYWGFDPEVQLLASRGYAVLQVNYRGSSGFNDKISRDDAFEFKKMHEDVTTATKYLIRQGIADPKRIAITGGSFGGYLALCGVAFEPDLYSCAVSNAGVFDWRKQVRSKFGKYYNYAYDFYTANLGGREQKEKLEEISPINYVKNIKAPVLVCGGLDDKNVDAWQSIKLILAMRRTKVKVETFLKGGEGHGFEYQKNQVAYYNKVLSFLEKNMGAPAK